MAFSQMLEILKEKEKGTIVFVKLGSFLYSSRRRCSINT